ncbi:MAG: hypothetical protein C0440_03155 [Candidatus Pelagibacter sp.]|nr:hypothetical protein [Candidatus Pelagibacter sp.]
MKKHLGKSCNSEEKKIVHSENKRNETDYFFFHDVNRMLRLVSNFSSILKKNDAVIHNEDAAKIVDFLGNVSGQMQELISFFLFQKNDNRKLNCTEVVDLSKIICDSWCKTYQLNSSEHPKLCMNSKSCKIKGNTCFLQQVFMNIFENAIRYKSEEDPKITVDIQEENKYVKIRISDNGIGLKSGEIEKIFMPSYRALRAGNVQGHGLGLAFSKQIIKLHNGNIWAESTQSKGACFVLELPCIVS